MIAGNPFVVQGQGQNTIATVYSPAVGVRAKIYKITVADVSGGASTFQLCVDDNGTTYTATTAIAWNTVTATGEVTEYVWERGLPLNSSSGNIAIQSNVNDDHNFTLVGEEFV